MKKTMLLTICLLMTVVISAQTQQGYVKTKGRLADNGSVIAGQRLSGTIVTLKGGSAVVSGNNGTFTLSIPGNNYYLQNVEKSGYVLVDLDVLSKQYAYSKNPLVLVLETPNQQANNKIAVERQIRRTLLRQLQEKEDEIESLKEKQKLNEDAYRQQLQELYAQQKNNEKLISEMAERYSKMDFDEVDEFNRHISSLILEGKLTEADSLLNTKGDIHSRTVVLRQHQEANAQEEQEIGKRQKKLEKSKGMAQKEMEDIARDCYSKFEIFKMQHQNDSAAYYLEFRAQLDTTNVEWQNDAGHYINTYLANYSKGLFYYQRTLRQSVEQAGDESSWTATANNNIGYVYSIQGDYPKALEYYAEALNIREKVFGPEHIEVANSYCNIGFVFYKQAVFSKALDYFEKALNVQEKVFGPEHPDVATFYNNIAGIYESQGEFAKALEYYSKALSIRENLFGTEHPDIAQSYNNVGSVYDSQQNYPKALECFDKALAIYEKVFGTEHPDVAMSYNNIGVVYDKQGDFSQASQYLSKALVIWKTVFGEDHPYVATSYNNMGGLYDRQRDYPKALEYYSKALDIQEEVFGSEHPDVALSYNNLGGVYYSQSDYLKALEYYGRALAIWGKVLGPEHYYVAQSSVNIGGIYFDKGDYIKALEYYTKALAIKEKVLGLGHSSTISTQNAILITKYQLALSSRDLPNFLSEHAFIVTVSDGDTPAKQQGMSGEYYLLEFLDWTQNECTSLFDKNEEMRGKPKDIVVMKNGVISKHYFENTIGVQFGIKEIGKEEKQRINKAYEDWKKQNRK